MCRYLNRGNSFFIDPKRYSTLAFIPSSLTGSLVTQSMSQRHLSRHHVQVQNFSTRSEQSESGSNQSSSDPKPAPTPQPIAGSPSRNKCLVFTCKRCGLRQAKWFSSHAYERGIVVARCGVYPDVPNAKPVEGCGSLHLIADNLGWFSGTDKGIKYSTPLFFSPFITSQ